MKSLNVQFAGELIPESCGQNDKFQLSAGI